MSFTTNSVATQKESRWSFYTADPVAAFLRTTAATSIPKSIASYSSINAARVRARRTRVLKSHSGKRTRRHGECLSPQVDERRRWGSPGSSARLEHLGGQHLQTIFRSRHD